MIGRRSLLYQRDLKYGEPQVFQVRIAFSFWYSDLLIGWGSA